MSKDIFVLTPNGRKVKVHCLPDTNLLQVLEDVCKRQGYNPDDYELKHHNRTIDLTTMLRYSNLPNKAMLEMVETERVREEMNVTIGLQLEDGERRTAEFSPHTSLFDVAITLAPTEITSLPQPTIMYMRQEVTGVPALKENTLRHLGLIKGRAILRLMNKPEEVKQANVSAVYRVPIQEKKSETEPNSSEMKKILFEHEQSENEETKTTAEEFQNQNIKSVEPGTSKFPITTNIDPVKFIQTAKVYLSKTMEEQNNDDAVSNIDLKSDDSINESETIVENSEASKTSYVSNTQKVLERRLQIEDEVTFIGSQKAVAFRQPDTMEDELDDLPDDFYELSIEEVRKLYKDLQQNRVKLENTPLISSSTREELEKEASKMTLNKYKNAVVRVQFPDHMVLQGVFSPTDTIGDVINFVKEHLRNPDVPFQIFTTPFKEKFDTNMTLLDAKFVPCVHMHFKLLHENGNERCLKEEVYYNETQSDAACMLASKYRAPTRRKADDNPETSQNANAPSTSKNSKVPKWFKK